MDVCFNGHDDIVQILFEQGFVEPPECINMCDGNTALIYASINGLTNAVKILLESGKALPEHKNLKGMSALMYAAKNGYVNVVKLLLEFKKNHPEIKDDDDEKSALILAYENGHSDVVKLFC